MDTLTPEQRTTCMKGNKSKDTSPEVIVRKLLHSMGFRFRLHQKKLPGCPELTLPKYKICIFVHGCFWHQHQGCKISHMTCSPISVPRQT
ncbi:very short patch repair endonuclease [Pseudomonas aeruginosa]